MLFGSRATGTTHEDSDVDILVVSPAYEGMMYVDRAAETRRAWELPEPVDFLCYTPEEFERLRREASIVSVAMEEGVEVGG